VQHQLFLATIPSATIHKPHTFHSFMVTRKAELKVWQKTGNIQKSTFKKADCIAELGIDEREWSLLDFYVSPPLS
jgi:hypothetical protein